MGQTVFYSSLNEFCQTYLITNHQLSPSDESQFPERLKEEHSAIFEQLMLFDKVSFKVQGENILVPVLLNLFGDYAFEALIEQEAIGFTLWTPMIAYMLTDVSGIDPLLHGTYSSAPHCDPEKSIELGLKWKDPALPRRTRRHLTKLLLPLYEMPSPELQRDAVKIVTSSYNSGKLGFLGFSPIEKDIRNLAVSERKLLCNCATELLEYSYLVKNNMTSFSNYHYFTLFNDSVSKVQSQVVISANFNQLAKIEHFPDLKALHEELIDPFKKISVLRVKNNSIKFRKWLSTTSASQTDADITKEYIDSLAEANGFFETKKGKITKSIVMTSIGTGIGAMMAGWEGALGGASVAKVLEPVTDFALDLVDEFLISGLTKGWSPRLFLGLS